MARQKRAKINLVFSLVLLLAVLSVNIFHAYSLEENTVTGYVYDDSGTPINGVKVRLTNADNFVCSNITSTSGFYTLHSESLIKDSKITVTYDDPETEGFDYLPVNYVFTDTFDGFLNFTLTPAASIVFEGQFFTVQPGYQVKSFEIKLTNIFGYILNNYYSNIASAEELGNQLCNIELTVPTETGFRIQINVLYRKNSESKTFTREYMGNENDIFILKQGDRMKLDVRGFILLNEASQVSTSIEFNHGDIERIESDGFYVTYERGKLCEAQGSFDKSLQLIKGGLYNEAYLELSNAYLLSTKVADDLQRLRDEAISSINLIVALISLTSLTVAFLLADKFVKRLLLTEGIFVVLLGYVYIVYPGCRLAHIDHILMVAFTSLLGLLLFVNIAPYFQFMKKNGKMSLFSSIQTSFMLGERNLRLRKLRTIFTFFTLMTLTASFVFLTSYSSMIGLVHKETGSGSPLDNGILVRMPEYDNIQSLNETQDVGYFYALSNYDSRWLKEQSRVETLSLKAEKLSSRAGWSIIGFTPNSDPVMKEIDKKVIIGECLREEGTCLVHESMIGKSTEIGGTVMGLRVVGAFNDSISVVNDLDGKSILPSKQVVSMITEEGRVILRSVQCNPSEVIITTYNSAINFDGVRPSRAVLTYNEGVNLETECKSLTLSSEYRFWVLVEGKIYSSSLGIVSEVKGLELFVLWGIVVITVIITMLSAIYERKKEINILSSVGLNPAHITGMYIAEGLIIGIVGGTLGYILGIGFYPLFSGLPGIPNVSMKVSFFWCLASLGVSLAAVIVGTLFALKGSVHLTPSHRRRWKLDNYMKNDFDHYTLRLPIQIEDNNYEEFVNYIHVSLRSRIFTQNSGPIPNRYVVNQVLIREKWGGCTISFGHFSGSFMDNTSNYLEIIRTQEGGEYSVILHTIGSNTGVREVGTLTRQLMIDWAIIQGSPILGDSFEDYRD